MNRHFRLNGGLIEGITASGRAAAVLLHLNDAEWVAQRLGLIDIGHYPIRRKHPYGLTRDRTWKNVFSIVQLSDGLDGKKVLCALSDC